MPRAGGGERVSLSLDKQKKEDRDSDTGGTSVAHYLISKNATLK